MINAENVYGISGRKFHGKDSLAKAIVRARIDLGLTPGFEITHFADELKNQAGRIFGLDYDQMHGKHKETPFSEPIEMDAFLEGMRRETGLDIQPAGLTATMPREVLQQFGTDYVRRAKDSYWVDLVINEAVKGHIIVPDLRFPNEANALRAIGGRIIKVCRIDFPDSHDGHVSETEMEKIVPDLLIGTVTNNFSLQTKLANYIAADQFDKALAYDYRKVQRAIAEFQGGANTRDVAEILGLPLSEAEFLLDYYKVGCSNCLGYRFLDSDHNVWRGQSSEEITPCGACQVDLRKSLI